MRKNSVFNQENSYLNSWYNITKGFGEFFKERSADLEITPAEAMLLSKTVFVPLLFVLLISGIVYFSCIIRDMVKKNKQDSCDVNNKIVFEGSFGKQAFCKSNSYEKVELLTQREKEFYQKLLIVADKLDYTVIAKIRFADLVNVNGNVMKYSSEWWSKFNKISSKHIDFALSQKDDLSIKLLIELDDSSHFAADRQERDAFVDSVCNQAGVPILHVWNANNLEEKIVTTIERFKSERF